MRTSRLAFAVILAVLSASTAPAADDVSGAMKKILESRHDDFAAIRTKPHDASGETVYMSTVVIPDAKECYIQPAAKPHYSDSCDVMESHNKAAVLGKYARFVKDVKALGPATWIIWTEKKSKPSGEETFFGPDHGHPAASVRWIVEGMNADYYLLSVTFYAEGYSHP
jgi:hypothetical protein